MSARPDPDPRRARVRIGVGAALVLLLVALGVAVLATAVSPSGSSTLVGPATPGPSASAGAGADPRGGRLPIFVHILGQVVRPGLYELDEGDRAVDAVAAAGGFGPTADQAAVNLARFLSDGEQIVVPAVGEAASAEGGAPGASSGSVVPGKVNVNTADAAELETLPRVGPAMAARIIEWREQNGRFAAVEDLMSVTGIGEKTFEGLADLVTT